MKLIHTCYRITDIDRSVAFYEALGFAEVGRIPIRDEAINVFMNIPGDGDMPRLELTYNFGVDAYDLAQALAGARRGPAGCTARRCIAVPPSHPTLDDRAGTPRPSPGASGAADRCLPSTSGGCACRDGHVAEQPSESRSWRPSYHVSPACTRAARRTPRPPLPPGRRREVTGPHGHS